MGFKEDVGSREGLVGSMRDVHLKQFIFIRNLAAAAGKWFGDAGVEALDEGFRQLGFWRGEYIRFRPETLAEGQDALSLVRNWDGCEIVLGSLDGPLEITGGSRRATIEFTAIPGSFYFKEHGERDLLTRYWRNVLEGMALGYHAPIRAEVPSVEGLDVPYPVTFVMEGTASADDGGTGSRDVLADPGAAIAMTRRASMNNGALYFFVARELVHRFDTAGEQAVREGVRGIGVERGLAHRDRHRRQGKELNLKNLMEDWDGPLVSVWTWRDEGFLSEGTWHQDCVYCPYADAWQQFGPEGLALGYLYDMEVHTAIYQTYHPGAVVQWEALKTRGDPVCKFRFSIQDLVQPGDPRFDPAAASRPHLPQLPTA
jgi:hypothetical protein